VLEICKAKERRWYCQLNAGTFFSTYKASESASKPLYSIASPVCLFKLSDVSRFFFLYHWSGPSRGGKEASYPGPRDVWVVPSSLKNTKYTRMRHFISSRFVAVHFRVSFRLAVLVYRCLHGSAPGYLASDLQRVSHLNARRGLRSSTTSALVAPRTVRSTIGDRTFPVTAASVWNSLLCVWSSPSLQVFRSRLKTELFARSYSRD